MSFLRPKAPRPERPMTGRDLEKYLEEYQEVQRYKEIQQQKVARHIGRVYDSLLDQATEYRGMTRMDGEMDDFDFRRLRHPREHKPGYMREVRLEDGVMLQTTTANALSDAVHNLFIFKGKRPNEYWYRSINTDCQAQGVHECVVGDEAIAELPGAAFNLGKIQSTFEIERANNWPQMLGADALAKLRRPESVTEDV